MGSSEGAPIRFECGECGRKISAPASAAGAEGSCPQCSEVLVIPEQSTRKQSKGGQTRQIKAPGPRRGGTGRRARRAPGEGRPAAIEPWQIVLLVVAVVGILVAVLVFALSGSGKKDDDEPKVARKKQEQPVEEPAPEPEKKQPAAEKKKKKGKSTPRKKKPPKGDPVKEIPYSAQADLSRQLEGQLVNQDVGRMDALRDKLVGLPQDVALPILLNAFRKLDVQSEEGAASGNWIHQVLIMVTKMEQGAPRYAAEYSPAERIKGRKDWFLWYWTRRGK